MWLLCKSKNFNVIYQTSRFATTKPPQGLAKRPLLALLPPTPWVHHTCHQLCHGLIPFTTQQRLHLRICRSEGREMDAVSFLGRHWNSSFSYGFLLSCTSALPPSNLLDVTFEEVNHGQKIANLRIMFGSARNVQLMSIVFPMCFVPAKKNMLMKSPSLSPWKMVTSSRRLSWWLDHPCLWRKFEPVAQLLAMLI